MRSFTIEERRNRLGARHHLATSAGSFVQLADDLVGLHSSDPATVYLASQQRLADSARDVVEASLYEARSTVRHLGMRRTMFVVSRELAPIMDAACTRALAPAQRKRVVNLLESNDVTKDGDGWISRVEDDIEDAIAENGPLTARSLTRLVPELSTKLKHGKGEVGASTRLLFLMSVEGRIVRGRPVGSWVSSQYEWSTMDGWLGHTLPETDPVSARADLAARWLYAYGPATVLDLKWWSGWSLTDTRQALRAIDAVDVDLHGSPGVALGTDLEPEDVDEPWAALLPSLDPSIMGWKERGWYLGSHEAALFDRTGNSGPVVLVNGSIVGGWGQDDDGKVVIEYLDSVTDTEESLVGDRAERLSAWFDGRIVTPRFANPLWHAISGR